MSILNGSSHSLHTLITSLTQIRREWLEDERRRAESIQGMYYDNSSISLDNGPLENTRIRALMAEAQLEAGENYVDTTSYDDTAPEYDHDDNGEMEELDSERLSSNFFQTCGLQQSVFTFLTYYFAKCFVCSGVTIHKRQDVRTRSQRYRHTHDAWTHQMTALVHAYMSWKHRPPEHATDNQSQARDEHIFGVSVVGLLGKLFVYTLNYCYKRSSRFYA